MVNPLARVIMKNNIVDKKDNYISESNNAINLGSKECQLIQDIIQGEKRAIEGKVMNSKISLDEAAIKIKNSR